MKPLAECHVLVTATSFGRFDPALKEELATAVGRVTYNETGKPLSSAQLAALLPGVDGYIAGLDVIDAAALSTADQLKVIARYGVGVDGVDLDAAAARRITVTNTPGANARSVAELTIALILNLARPIHAAAVQVRQGAWPRTRGLTLEGRTVGIIGLGAIGKEVARRLAGFDVNLLAFDVQQDAAFAAAHGVQLRPLADVLAAADFVTLHVPLLPQTSGMVDGHFLAQMKEGSYLINTSRGELIDEPALATALASKHLAGAALDAFRSEPPAPDDPLLAFEQLIPTPHMGAHTDGATNAMGRLALADCLAVLDGREPRFRVV